MAGASTGAFAHQKDLLLLLVICAVSLFGLYVLIVRNKRNIFPPAHGWIPFIGCAVEFGKGPLNFIRKAKEKVGP